MERLLVIGGLFVLAGLCEIGDGYLVWGWMREHKPLAWALLGAAVLAAYGVVAALQPISEFGRAYAAYGGIFIAGRGQPRQTLLRAALGACRAAPNTIPRPAPHLRHGPAVAGHPPQGGPGDARPREHFADDGHLQPRAPRHAGQGRGGHAGRLLLGRVAVRLQ